MRPSPTWWRALLDRRFPNDIARAKAALAAGDFLTALDLLRHAPDDPDIRRRTERDYLLVLALARAGAARLGLECFRERLAHAPLEALPADMARDIAALEARCLKDIALEAPADARREALIEAADAYETVYRRFGGYYPLINAATLFLLAGEQAMAENLARQTLREVADSKDYWGLATKAEALLVLGKSDEVGAGLEAGQRAGRVGVRHGLHQETAFGGVRRARLRQPACWTICACLRWSIIAVTATWTMRTPQLSPDRRPDGRAQCRLCLSARCAAAATS